MKQHGSATFTVAKRKQVTLLFENEGLWITQLVRIPLKTFSFMAQSQLFYSDSNAYEVSVWGNRSNGKLD
jgi:hypothetical protein